MSCSGVQSARRHLPRTPRTPLNERERRLKNYTTRASRGLEAEEQRYSILGPTLTARNVIPGPGAYVVPRNMGQPGFSATQYTSGFAPLSHPEITRKDDSGPGPAAVNLSSSAGTLVAESGMESTPRPGCSFGIRSEGQQDAVPGPGKYPLDRSIVTTSALPWYGPTKRKMKAKKMDPGPGPASYDVETLERLKRCGPCPVGFTMRPKSIYPPAHESGDWTKTPGPGSYTRSGFVGGLVDKPDTPQYSIRPGNKMKQIVSTPGPADYKASTERGPSSSGLEQHGFSIGGKNLENRQNRWMRPSEDSPGPHYVGPMEAQMSDRRDHHAGSCTFGSSRGVPPGTGGLEWLGSDGPGPKYHPQPPCGDSPVDAKMGLKNAWPHQEHDGTTVPGPGSYQVVVPLRQHGCCRNPPSVKTSERGSEVGPGPAKYDVSKDLKVDSIVHRNPPRMHMGQKLTLKSETCTPGPGAYQISRSLQDKTSTRTPHLSAWDLEENSKKLTQRERFLPAQSLQGLLQPAGMPLLPLGNLPALLRIASQNPSLAEAFHERCEVLAAANPAMVPFIEELHASAGIGLVRTSEANSASYTLQQEQGCSVVNAVMPAQTTTSPSTATTTNYLAAGVNDEQAEIKMKQPGLSTSEPEHA